MTGPVLQWSLIALVLVETSNGMTENQTQNQYIDYRPGTINIILSAPHGGNLKPSSIPDRLQGGCWDADKKRCIFTHDCGTVDPSSCPATIVKDVWTWELTELLVNEIEALFGGKPHVVINKLHRRKLDPNRDIGEAAFGEPEAEEAWTFYQRSINQSKAAVGGMGIFVDIHGQSHPEKWIELGYLHSGKSLDNGDLDPNHGSLRKVASRVSATAPYRSLLSGNASLGACLESAGYKTVPSPSHPGPAGGKYFTGGYNTVKHGSMYSGAIDAVQIESPRYLRDEVRGPQYARDLAICLKDFMSRHYAPGSDENPVNDDGSSGSILIPKQFAYIFIVFMTVVRIRKLL